MPLSVFFALFAPSACDASPSPSPTLSFLPSSPYYGDEYNWTEEEEDHYRHYHGYYDDEDGYAMRETAPPELRAQPCPGPHTFRNRWGDCECESGFYYGDPFTSDGCWVCADTCHQEALCVAPGRCQCIGQYHGDGVTCEVVAPLMLGIAPVEGWCDQTTEINVAYVWNVEERANIRADALCRLGTERRPPRKVTNDTIVCLAGPRPPGVVDVAVSLDGVVWTAEEFRFVYKNRFDVMGILPIVGIYAMVIAGIAVCIWRGVRRATPERGDEGERKPFLGGTQAEGAGVAKKKRGARRRGRP